MSEALIGVIITSLISLIGIFLSAKDTRDKVTSKLDTNQQLMNAEITHIKENITDMKADIKSHNNYAKMFSESVPVLQEQIKSVDRRLSNMESKNQ